MDVLTSFLDIALPLAERGFRVFPLIPKQKRPVAFEGDYDHFDAATTDAEQIRAWACQEPTANVGLSPDEVWCYLETDDEAALREACADLPPEVWDTARVSARENRCYYIFRQTMRTKQAGNMTVTCEGRENLFEFKEHRVYVVGPGSIHPRTNAPYAVEWQRIPAMPDVLLNQLCELYGKPKATESAEMNAETKRQTELLDRFLTTYEVATTGDWFVKGKSWYRPIECPWRSAHENDNQGTSTCIVYTDGAGYGFDCKHRCAGKGWKEFRAELQRRHPEKTFSFVAEVTLGSDMTGVADGVPIVADWKTHYHTLEEMENAPPPTFLIDGFLTADSITAIGAPVGQRKSLIVLNPPHALCTNEPLFDHFKVVSQPTRVLYLCPEMGLRSFTSRVRAIGLLPYVGKTLFCRTLSAVGRLELGELTPEKLRGAVVILDTAIRYLEGDENSSEDMRVFAEQVFRLMRDGAAAVLLLHHSSKGTKESNELTLENAMRGSGELAGGPDCRLHVVGDPALAVATLAPRHRGQRGE